MAKGNLFLGHAKGKVGSVVFSRAFGQQITRTKPSSVKNPKTIGQNTQRAILATIAKSAAAMTSLVDHSFAGVTYGAESVRHFRKINMGILRNLYLNTQNGANLIAKGGSFLPNPLKVSGGSLPAFSASVTSADSTIAFYQTDKYLPRNEDVTVEDFLAAYPYLQGGDQLTLVMIKKIAGTMGDGDGIFTMSLDRMVFAPNAFDNPEAVIIEKDAGTITDSFLDLTKTTNVKMLNLADGGPGSGLGFSYSNCYYAALILSRKVNNQWQRSEQFLEQMNFDDFANNESAIESYGNTASTSEATEYLNQAEESVPTSGVSGAYMALSVKVGDDLPRAFNVNAGSVEDETLQGAAGTVIAISAQAFAPTGKRIITVEIDRPDGSYAAHGEKSLNYNVAIAAGTAGMWKVAALYDDGTRAVYQMTLAVQS